MLKPGEAVEEVGAPLIHIDDVVFTSCMNHFLHGPNTPLDSVRARILAAVPIGAERTSRRVYLTRRVQKKRRMVNERKLEAALIARGFTVIEPEALSITEQVDLFRSVDVVVAPTGAALANVLFMKPGAKLFELQPANYMGIWVRALAHFVGAHWHGYFCPSPLKESRSTWAETHRPGLSFSWSLPCRTFWPSWTPTFLHLRRRRHGPGRGETRKPSKFSRLRGQPSGMT
jgi:capsular polysaccharide biosynthesis protein